jgi:ATP-dependent protease Clp ATPase subunit
MEHLMMELMYEAPGRKDLGEIVVSAELVKAQIEDPGALVRRLRSA